MKIEDFPSLNGVKQSDVFMTLLSPAMLEHPENDVKPIIELGAAMILDKPILILQADGIAVPENLRKVAKKIIPIKMDDPKAASAAIAKAVKELQDGS